MVLGVAGGGKDSVQIFSTPTLILGVGCLCSMIAKPNLKSCYLNPPEVRRQRDIMREIEKFDQVHCFVFDISFLFCFVFFN